MLNRRSSLVFLIALIVAILVGTGFYLLRTKPSLQVNTNLSPPVKATAFVWEVQISHYLDWFALTPNAPTTQSTPDKGVMHETPDQLSDPFGILIDKENNIILADAGAQNRILRIDPQGKVSLLAGSSEGFSDTVRGVNDENSAAKFNTPSGIAIDSQGNVYVADTGNNAIRKISPRGEVLTIAGTGIAGYRDGAAKQAQFNGPIGVAVDKSGKVYVADTYNDKIRVIGLDGMVSTIAGGNAPGFRDGLAQDALFDTPSSLVINSKDELIVADTRNNAIRKISKTGVVSTIVASGPKDFDALLRRPIGLAVAHDDYLYVGEASHGRILQISPTGEMRGLTGVDIDIIPGDDTSARLQTPVGIAINKNGNLFITDTGKTVVHQLSVKGIVDTSFTTPKRSIILTEEVVKIHPWPLLPQDQTHELVGTIGEVRGDNNGESRDHFHRGVDMQAAMGAPVVVIADEKVSSPLPAWSAGNLNEGMRIDKLSYIHMRVGRRMDESALSTEKFKQVKDAQGKLQAIRVKRGTRFSVGETIGTVNSMYHVHLNYAPQGDVVNPLGLAFIGFKDSVAPQISGIDVVDKNGRPLLNKRRQDLSKISRSVGEVSIIVDAFDQADGNAARRRLGLYQVGYQILGVDGKPLPGYEKPRITIHFNRLPPDEEAVKVAYAEQSGITAHGNASTKFLYNVTNEIHNGHAITGFWNIKDLPAGDYRIRIHAADYAGNLATTKNELLLRLD